MAERRSSNVAVNGERLAAIRRRMGLSQVELAQKMKVTESRVQQLEAGGTQSIYGRTARELAVALGISMDRLRAELAPGAAEVVNSEVQKFTDAMAKVQAEARGAAEWDKNVDPYTEQRVPAEPPQFDLAVAAGAWTEVSDMAVLMQPGQIDSGLFRIWIRGDSMEKDWPNGSLVEFRCLRQLRDVLEVGRDYYVQVDGEATFKRLVKVDEENLVFSAVNKRKYPKPFVVERAGIVRMAVAEWMLSRPGKR